MEFLHSFLRCHFMEKPGVALQCHLFPQAAIDTINNITIHQHCLHCHHHHHHHHHHYSTIIAPSPTTSRHHHHHHLAIIGANITTITIIPYTATIKNDQLCSHCLGQKPSHHHFQQHQAIITMIINNITQPCPLRQHRPLHGKILHFDCLTFIFI